MGRRTDPPDAREAPVGRDVRAAGGDRGGDRPGHRGGARRPAAPGRFPCADGDRRRDVRRRRRRECADRQAGAASPARVRRRRGVGRARGGRELGRDQAAREGARERRRGRDRNAAGAGVRAEAAAARGVGGVRLVRPRRRAREGARGGRGACARGRRDLLFAIVALGRRLDLDAEAALRRAARRFRDRFLLVEQAARDRGIALADLDEDALGKLWEEAKSR